MLSNETIFLYADFVKSHNVNPDSEETGYAFSFLAENMYSKYDEDSAQEILNALLVTKEDDQINMMENLITLDIEFEL